MWAQRKCHLFYLLIVVKFIKFGFIVRLTRGRAATRKVSSPPEWDLWNRTIRRTFSANRTSNNGRLSFTKEKQDVYRLNVERLTYDKFRPNIAAPPCGPRIRTNARESDTEKQKKKHLSKENSNWNESKLESSASKLVSFLASKNVFRGHHHTETRTQATHTYVELIRCKWQLTHTHATLATMESTACIDFLRIHIFHISIRIVGLLLADIGSRNSRRLPKNMRT